MVWLAIDPCVATRPEGSRQPEERPVLYSVRRWCCKPMNLFAITRHTSISFDYWGEIPHCDS